MNTAYQILVLLAVILIGVLFLRSHKRATRPEQLGDAMQISEAESFKRIPLSQGQFALVDVEDFGRVNAYKWCARWEKRTRSFYAVRITSRPNRTMIQMSRFIMQTNDDMVCDHINHDTLDNRKQNLRNCTMSQNRMNQKKKDGHTSTEFKNITVHRNGYRVTIWANGKIVYRKVFKGLDDAIASRNEALKKHHGKFANIE